MKIISWNLLRLTGASLHNVAALIEHERPDVLLMQEATRFIDPLTDLVGGHYIRHRLPGNVHGHGPAIWSRNPFHKPPVELALQNGLLIQRVCQLIDFGEFSVANVHLSHGQVLNRRQLRRIGRRLSGHAAIIGDYNLVGPVFLKDFRDVGPREPTHRCGDLIPLRLDRCLVRGLECRDAHVLSASPSDHHPIAVTLTRAATIAAVAA
jgi:endonuclease/exonuclease/phosphatase (EEP) superfamily protein YafD